MKMSLKLAVLSATVFAFAPISSEARDLAVPGATPKSAAAIFSINDTKGLWAGISQSPLNAPISAMFANPALANDPGYATFLAERAKAEAELGYSITGASLLGEVLKGVDVYLVPPTEGSDEPGFVVAASFASEANVTKTMDHILKGIAEDSGETATEFDVNGAKVKGFPSQSMFASARGTTLFVSSSEAGIRETLEADGSADILQSADFQASMKGLADKPGQSWFYGDGANLAKIMELAPGGSDLASAASAIEGMVIAGVGSFEADKIRFSSYTPANKLTEVDKSVLASTTAGPNGSARFLPDAGWVYFAMQNFNWKTMLDGAAADAANAGPEAQQAMEMQRMMLEQGGMSIGLSFENDVLPVLGSEFSVGLGKVVMDLMGGGAPNADLVIATKVTDNAKATELMTKLEGALADAMKAQFESQGVAPPADLTLFATEESAAGKMRVFTPPAGMESQVPVAPAYSITNDGYLVLAMSKGGLSDALTRSTGGQSFANGALNSKVGAFNPAGSFQKYFIDLPKIVEFASPLAMMFAGQGMDEMQRNMMVSAFDVAKAMGTAYYGVSVEETGRRSDLMFVMK